MAHRGISEIERWHRLYSAIPVYPDEIDRAAIRARCGFGVTELIALIYGMPASAMMCEDGGRYSWLSAEDRRRVLRRLTDEKRKLMKEGERA